MCRTVVLQISHTCCKHSYQPSACSSCFNQYFPFLPGGENIHNYFIKSIASTHYFIDSITSSRCVEDTPRYTLVHDKYSPACWVSRKLRPKGKTIPCYTADCFKSSCLVRRYNVLSECVWFCNVTPDLYRKTVTQQTLRYPNGLANHLQ